MLILRRLQKISLINSRTYKNFGHKRQPTPTVTVLWQGFLTFMFVGICVEWKKIATFIFGMKDNESLPQIHEEPNKK